MGWFDQAQPPLPLPVLAAQMGGDTPTWSMGRPPAMPPDNSAPMPQFPAPDAGRSVPMYPPGERPPGQWLPPGVSSQIPQHSPAPASSPQDDYSGMWGGGMTPNKIPSPSAPPTQQQAPPPINTQSPEWRAMSQEQQMRFLDDHLAQQEAARRYSAPTQKTWQNMTGEERRQALQGVAASRGQGYR